MLTLEQFSDVAVDIAFSDIACAHCGARIDRHLTCVVSLDCEISAKLLCHNCNQHFYVNLISIIRKYASSDKI